MLSLHSHTSRSSNSRPTVHGDQVSAGSSVVRIAQPEGVNTVESYALRDVKGSDAMRPEKGEIRLHKTLQQEER